MYDYLVKLKIPECLVNSLLKEKKWWLCLYLANIVHHV